MKNGNKIADRTPNRRKKTTIFEGIAALLFAPPTDYNREYELRMKRNGLDGAILKPSQDVFGQMRKGQS